MPPSMPYSKEDRDFLLAATGKAKYIASAYATRFCRAIDTRAVNRLRLRHDKDKNKNKFSKPEMEFVLAASGTDKAIAQACTARFGKHMSTHSVKHMRQNYLPGKPIPPEGNGKYSREQLEFVVASHGSLGNFRVVAEQFCARYPGAQMGKWDVRNIMKTYGPGRPLPTDGSFGLPGLGGPQPSNPTHPYQSSQAVSADQGGVAARENDGVIDEEEDEGVEEVDFDFNSPMSKGPASGHHASAILDVTTAALPVPTSASACLTQSTMTGGPYWQPDHPGLAAQNQGFLDRATVHQGPVPPASSSRQFGYDANQAAWASLRPEVQQQQPYGDFGHAIQNAGQDYTYPPRPQPPASFWGYQPAHSQRQRDTRGRDNGYALALSSDEARKDQNTNLHDGRGREDEWRV